MKHQPSKFATNCNHSGRRYGTWTSGDTQASSAQSQCQIFFPSQDKDLVLLVQRMRKLLEISKKQESLEEKILTKFGELPTLEECLKYCLEEYAEKENQLRTSLEIAVEFHSVTKNLIEISAEASKKCEEARDMIDSQAIECQKLQNENQQLHEEVARLRNRTDYIAMEYQYQKQNRNQLFKQVLRETYENDKEEIDRISGVLSILQLDLEKKTKKIIEYEIYRTQVQRQLAQNQQLIEDLTFQNTKLKQQIKLLSNLKNQDRSKTSNKIYQTQIISAILTVKQAQCRVDMKNELDCVDFAPHLNNKQSVNKKQVGLNLQVEKDQNNIHFPVIYKQPIIKAKIIKKMKSMTIRPYDQQSIDRFEPKYDQKQKYQSEQIAQYENSQNPNFLMKQQFPVSTATEGPKDTMEGKYLYKVGSIDRFSEVSQVNRLSGAFYNNLAEQYREDDKVQQKCKNYKSIGLMTEPNEEQQFINGADMDSPIHSPYKRLAPCAPLNLQKSILHKSCLIIDDPIKESKFFHANKSNRNEQKKQMVSTDSQNPQNQNIISSLFQSIVSRRTHKNIQKVSPVQLESRRKSKQNMSKLSKSFISTFSSIKQSIIGIGSKQGEKRNVESNYKKPSIKYMSKSTISLANERQENWFTSGADKKNRVAKAEEEDKEKQQISNFMDTLFNFAVRNRIKK